MKLGWIDGLAIVLAALLCSVRSAPAQFFSRGEIQLVQTYDKDGDGVLNSEERAQARQAVRGRSRQGRRGFSRGYPSGTSATDATGPKLSPDDVETYPDVPLYDMGTLRTLFLDFPDDDWETEMVDFYDTDVEVPAKLTVDGKVYPDVGVHFRGLTSFRETRDGQKRSLGLSLDYIDDDQRLDGYRTLNLLNSASDPTFLRIVLYMEIARDYIPAPKANFVRVVINGESWGVYINSQQVNKDFLDEWFDSNDGARWKIPGSPNGQGGMAYLGDDPDIYRRIYEIKSKDKPESWSALIEMFRVLNLTPPEELEDALEPLLDIDGALRFLAVDKALINNDGYWTRASDYYICQDEDGRFHAVPHDANETFRPVERFGGGWAGGSGGINLDPFTGANNQYKSLLYRLLAVPSLRERYLGYIRDVAENWLIWDRVGPIAERYQALIADDVASDVHKLYPTADFTSAVTEDTAERGFGPGAASGMSLKTFVEQRRAYLLNYPEIRALEQDQ